MNLKINLAGTFEGKVLNEETTVILPGVPNGKLLLEELNKTYGVAAFSPRNMKKNLIAVLVNGERLTPNDLKRTLHEEDIITILQPIMGG